MGDRCCALNLKASGWEFETAREMKRIVDILGSSLNLFLLSPVLAIMANKIRREMSSPIMFRQTWPDRHGTPFQLIKFRTMRDALDANRHPLING